MSVRIEYVFESNECSNECSSQMSVRINYIFDMNECSFELSTHSSRMSVRIKEFLQLIPSPKEKVHTNDAGIKRFSGLRDFCREAKRRKGEMSE